MRYRVTMLDDHSEIVSNVHRRRLLLDLLHENPRIVRTDLTDVREPDEKERAVLMYHLHLPKLEDHGYIEWDDETGEVTKGNRFAEIEPILTVLTEYRGTFSDSASTD